MTQEQQKKSILRRVGKVLIGFTAVVFTVILLLQVAFFAGVWWLNSQGGQEWIQKQIELALQDSDYHIDIGHYQYSALSKVKIAALSVHHKNTLVFQAKNIHIGADVLPLAARNLALTLYAEQAIVYNIPADEDIAEEQGGFSLPSFRLPDSYFTSLSLENLRIKNLEIKKDALGIPLFLSPDIKVTLEKDSPTLLGLSANISLYQPKSHTANPSWLPYESKIDGKLNTATSELHLSDIEALAPLYDVNANGQTVLDEKGQTHIQYNAIIESLSRLSDELKGSATSSGVLSGTLQNLSLTSDVDIDIDDPAFLSKITGQVTAQNILASPIKGEAQLNSAYQEKSISLQTEWEYLEDALFLIDIQAKAPEAVLVGNAQIDIETGLVKGDVTANIESLEPYQNFIDTEISGQGQLNAEFYHNQKEQAVRIDSSMHTVSYQGVHAEQFNFETDITDLNNILYSDFNVVLKDMKYDNVIVNTLRFRTDVFQKNDFIFTIESDGQYHEPFHLKGTTMLTRWHGDVPTLKNINIDGVFSHSPFTISGDLNRKTADLTLTTENIPVSPLFPDAPAFLSGAIATGKTTLKGPLDNPVLNSDLTIESRYAESDDGSVTLRLQARFKDQITTASLSGTGSGINDFYGDIRLPVIFSIEPFAFTILENQPVEGNIEGGLRLAPLADLFLSPNHELSGRMTVSASMTGTLKDPDMQGDIQLYDTSYRNLTFGLNLKDITSHARFDDEMLRLENFRASDGGSGALTGQGKIHISNMLTRTDIAFNADHIHLLKGGTVDGTVSGNLSLEGIGEKLALTGNIRSPRMDLSIPSQLDNDIPSLNIMNERITEPEKETPITLDIQFQAEDKIFLSGWGLEAELGGKLDITGTIDEPEINGTLSSIRGRYEEFGKRFDIENARLRFQGTVPPSPYLDVKVSTTTNDITAFISLTGSIVEPEINFSSTPPLPDDQILSRFLFGEDIAQISPFQAIQLARTMQRFTGGGGGGFDPIGSLREATGLDDLSIDRDAEGGMSVGVGKYLTDEVYLELERGTGDEAGTAANVEVELSPHITLESQIGQQSGGGVFWSWDY